jgi:hypothetical protein
VIRSNKIIQAKVITTMIRVECLQIIEGDIVAEVSCNDYDEYKALPQAIEVKQTVLGKTGWSSDKGYACYKSNVLLGQIIDCRL